MTSHYVDLELSLSLATPGRYSLEMRLETSEDDMRRRFDPDEPVFVDFDAAFDEALRAAGSDMERYGQDILLSTLQKSFFADTDDHRSCPATLDVKFTDLDGPRVGWLEDSEYVPGSRRGASSIGHGTWKWVPILAPGSCACDATACRE